MRIIFAGTPDTAIPTLAALARQHQIIAVLTRPPAPKGRKKILTNSPVHDYALAQGFPVYTPKSLKTESALQLIQDLAPDAVAVVAYGLLVPEQVLQIPRYGWLNLHYSLLPRWRGASPVQAAIAAGDSEIGTCVFELEKGLDTGRILSVERGPLDPQLTADELLTQLSESGAAQMTRVFTQLAEGSASYTPQSGSSTYAHLLTSEVAEIDWARPAAEVRQQIHAYISQPGSWTKLAGTRIKIGKVSLVDTAESSDLPAGSVFTAGKKVRVATGVGAVELSTVSPAGKKWMNARDWLRGVRSENPRFSLPQTTPQSADATTATVATDLSKNAAAQRQSENPSAAKSDYETKECERIQ